MATDCGICGATNDAYICPDDTKGFAGDLVRAAGVIQDLRITHANGDVRTGPGPIHGQAGPAPLPWNEAASVLLADLDRHLRRPSDGGTPLERIALTRARQADLARRHPASPEFAKGLRRLLDRAQRVTDRRATLWTFGVCHCGQQLTGEPDTATVACGRCKTGHDAAALKERQWAAAAGTLVTQAEAAQWLAIRYDVDPRKVEALRKRINLWVHRGRIETSPGVVDGKPQDLVLFGSVDGQWRKVQAMAGQKATRNRQAATTTTRSA